MGELLVDVPGAMWMRDRLDELRRSQAPTSLRIVVAIDLSGTGGEEADECSIVAVGVDAARAGCWLTPRDVTSRLSGPSELSSCITVFTLTASRCRRTTRLGG